MQLSYSLKNIYISQNSLYIFTLVFAVHMFCNGFDFFCTAEVYDTRCFSLSVLFVSFLDFSWKFQIAQTLKSKTVSKTNQLLPAYQQTEALVAQRTKS